VVEKALSYITCGGLLLVFRQPQFPEQGIQVPGGSVEPGEAAAAAALREASEETGLAGLRPLRYLGHARYRLKVDRGPPHQRHFFHLAFDGPCAASWLHPGSRRSDGTLVTFELWWEPLSTVRLDWEMDAYLQLLRH
jgi:8-oxo-dGTP pyrophosphatase MutT (NUDIX family)